MHINTNSHWRKLAAVLLISAPLTTAAGDAVVATPAPDIEAGEAKSQVCVACHGEEGVSQQDNYPHLHGQQQTYLLRQMHYFRDGGDRRDPIMTPMLEAMTDQDLVNLATYYSSLGGVLGSSTPSNNGVDEVMPTPAVDKAGDVAVRTEPPPPSAPAAVTPSETRAMIRPTTMRRPIIRTT